MCRKPRYRRRAHQPGPTKPNRSKHMKQPSQSKDEVSQIPCRAAMKAIAAMFLLLAAGFSAQAQQSNQPAGSLADVARQSRAQKQAQPSPESNRAQQVADQLAEDQDDKDAPAGFRTTT